MRSSLVTDTSVVFAALDPQELDHEPCAELVTSALAVVPAPVVTETCMLVASRGKPRAVDAFLASIIDGTVAVVDLEYEDYRRARDLVHRYADLPLGFVDASIVAIAERLDEHTIATLDRRHFSVVKPLHCESFTLVP
jgi:predicted nucleic acid-binding protein